jgi:hypothetical protein
MAQRFLIHYPQYAKAVELICPQALDLCKSSKNGLWIIKNLSIFVHRPLNTRLFGTKIILFKEGLYFFLPLENYPDLILNRSFMPKNFFISRIGWSIKVQGIRIDQLERILFSNSNLPDFVIGT